MKEMACHLYTPKFMSYSAEDFLFVVKPNVEFSEYVSLTDLLIKIYKNTIVD